jgi:hypothetical protein
LRISTTSDTFGTDLYRGALRRWKRGQSQTQPGWAGLRNDAPLALSSRLGAGIILYAEHGAKTLCNLFLTMAERMGVKQLERFGDSTGALSDV